MGLSCKVLSLLEPHDPCRTLMPVHGLNTLHAVPQHRRAVYARDPLQHNMTVRELDTLSDNAGARDTGDISIPVEREKSHAPTYGLSEPIDDVLDVLELGRTAPVATMSTIVSTDAH